VDEEDEEDCEEDPAPRTINLVSVLFAQVMTTTTSDCAPAWNAIDSRQVAGTAHEPPYGDPAGRVLKEAWETAVFLTLLHGAGGVMSMP
jgi:hypothetical protein